MMLSSVSWSFNSNFVVATDLFLNSVCNVLLDNEVAFFARRTKGLGQVPNTARIAKVIGHLDFKLEMFTAMDQDRDGARSWSFKTVMWAKAKQFDICNTRNVKQSWHSSAGTRSGSYQKEASSGSGTRKDFQSQGGRERERRGHSASGEKCK
jgi:hypothetical protein